MLSLEKDSWIEIFDSIPSQKCQQSPYFYRKIAKVRIPKKHAIMATLGILHGRSNEHFLDIDEPPYYMSFGQYRPVYGEVLFHSRHRTCKDVPFQNQTQLNVTIGGTIYSGMVSSTSVYLCPKTRLGDKVYSRFGDEFKECRDAGPAERDLKPAVDRMYAMLREWKY